MLRLSNNKWVIFLPDVFLRFSNEGMKMVWECVHTYEVVEAVHGPQLQLVNLLIAFCHLSLSLHSDYFSLGSNS